MLKNCRRSKAAAVRLHDATVERRTKKTFLIKPWLAAAKDEPSSLRHLRRRR
jgi:hypothetical protein